jgi:predicted  nucleic acid-binding Zn-ribbon protein
VDLELSWGRRSRRRVRVPHPDPARELELQRILDLRVSITRREDLIGQYRKEIGDLHYTVRDETNVKRIEVYLREAATLHDRITETETSITVTHEEIAALQAKIPSDDLAYL